MVAPNLTKANFHIYIEDKQKLLTNISWESCSEIGMTAETISTSNGRKRYSMSARPTPKPITLSKGANVDEDWLLNQWLKNYCKGEPAIDNLEDTGTVLILTPLRPCLAADPYPQRIKVFNLIPSDWSLWDADIMSTTDVSRSTIICNWTDYDMTNG